MLMKHPPGLWLVLLLEVLQASEEALQNGLPDLFYKVMREF